MISLKDTSTKVRTYTSIEDTPIYVFYEILENKDYSKLLVEGEAENETLIPIWERIFNEYFEEAGIKTPEWKEHIKLDDLEKKYRCVSGLLHIVCKLDANFKDAVEALKKWNYHIRENQPLESEIKRLYKGLESLFTKIQIMQGSIEKPHKQAKLNIYREVIRLKKHFKFDIDVKRTVCKEWIHLNQQFQEDVAELNKKNGKRGN